MIINKTARTAILASLLISSAVIFTGCQDVIYAKIMNEVALDDATISGSVNSIVRFESNIYIENGKVYYKAASSSTHDTWNECMNGLTSVSYDYYGKAFSGTQIIKLAADKTNLYALGITYTENNDKGKNVPEAEYLFYYDGSSWQKGSSVTIGTATLFCTNTPNPDYRKAYIRTDSKVYELSGPTSISSLTPITTNGAGSSSCSAIYSYSGDTVYFRNEWATGCNANAVTASGYTTVDGTAGGTPVYYYYASGDNLYYSIDASFSTSSSHDLDMTSINALAVTSDAILLGTNGSGLYKVSNLNGIPGSSAGKFNTNADSALGSPYRILTMFCVDPSQSETGAILYASADFTGTSSSTTGDYSDIGLWSYYPGRGNWNRE